MRTLTNYVRLQGRISLHSKTSFSINGLGFRQVEIVSGESFSIEDNHDTIIILQEGFPVYRLDPRKALLVNSKLVDGKFLTSLQTF